MTPRTPSRRPAFTIIELALSVMVMTTLMAAMGSAVLLASKAIPADDTPAQAAIDHARALEMIATDIAEALHFVERTPTTLAFTVSDRDGDGSPERIRYAWDGTPGNPLTRQIGTATPREVVSNVENLVFTSVRETTSQTLPPAMIDGPEQIVTAYQALSLGTLVIDGDVGAGESFSPDLLAAETSSWRLTGVETRAKIDGQSPGTLELQIRPAAPTGEPTAEVLAVARFAESLLGAAAFEWTRMSIDAARLDPAGRYAFVLFDVGSGKGGQFEYQPAGVVRAGQALVTGNDLGGWVADPDPSLTYRVYGRPQIPGLPIDVVREHVTAIGLDLKGATPLLSRVAVPNTPQITSAYWHLDFENAPTSLDVDADTDPDWATADALPFDAASLLAGVWSATQTLVSSPEPKLDTPLTMTVRLRDTTPGDTSAAEVLLAVDRDGLAGANLRLRVRRISDSQQRITLISQRSAGERTLVSRIVTTTGFVDVLATVIPVSDLVSLRINGEDVGTFQYDRLATADAARVELAPTGGSGAQFEDLIVRANP